MKPGVSLQELAAKLEERKAQKRDLIAPTSEISMTEDAKSLHINGQDDVTPTDYTLRQIGTRLNIPAKYFDRMKNDAPQLLANNVNHWFANQPENRMIRCLNTTARAFLSDRYQRIDNEEVAEAVLPVLFEVPGLTVQSCEVTERRMYIKAVTDRVQGEVNVGDTVQAGIVISNSEIGAGALNIQPLIFRLACLNGMTINDARFQAKHIGARADSRDEVYQLISDEARRADDHAILLKTRDVTKAAIDETFFKKQVARLREAAGQPIEARPDKAVVVLASKTNLTDKEHTSVLDHLIKGGDMSRWGMINAVTAMSQEVEDYDRATELEALGGKILDLSSQEWSTISEARIAA